MSMLFAIVLLVAALHIAFGTLEMFLWTKPTGLKILRMTKLQADQSAKLAANQGLYNFFGTSSPGCAWADCGVRFISSNKYTFRAFSPLDSGGYRV